MDPNRLPSNAYEIKEGETYLPYVREPSVTEFTIKTVVAGALLGMVFGAANTYLGLKAGLTISTSIPVAVLSVVAFKLIQVFGIRHTILELNMSQTIGSASSSVASGVLFTIPALFMWGLAPKWGQLTLLAMLNADRFPGEIGIDELSSGFARLARRSAKLRADVGPPLDSPEALRGLIEENPVAAWV